MEEEPGGLLFSTSLHNVPQQFSISLSNVPANDESQQEHTVDTVSAANDLLENGVLVETNKGVVCLSWKDALVTGVGGLKLSAEDLQNVAEQLLNFQQNPDKILQSGSSSITSGEVQFDITDASQVVYKHLGVIPASTETPNGTPLEVQVTRVEGHQGSQRTVVEDRRLTKRNHSVVVRKKRPPANHVRVTKSEQELPGVDMKGDDNLPKNGTQKNNSNNGGGDSAVTQAKDSSFNSGPAENKKPLEVPSSEDSNPPKRRGGWPKGRKRKPQLMECQPPKAPVTGYVLYLNEKRKTYKDLPFPQVTKILGNEWSKMNLDDKRPYLERAEEDKHRYRAELKTYRQSDAYLSYLRNKRARNRHVNGTEESDGTDEDEEDNEELYCRTCDQWFTSLHNKKEHLYGRQHLQAIASDMSRDRQEGSSGWQSATSVDESSLEDSPSMLQQREWAGEGRVGPSDMSATIAVFLESHSAREEEIKLLRKNLADAMSSHERLVAELISLTAREARLAEELDAERGKEVEMNQELCNLLTVPALLCSLLSGDEQPTLMCYKVSDGS